MDVEFLRNRTVDDDQRCARVRGGLHRIKIEGFLAHGFDCQHHERKILGPAPGHDGVRGETQWSGLAVTWCNFCNRLMPRSIAVFEHAFDARYRGRHHRQPVTPAALVEQLINFLEVFFVIDNGQLLTQQRFKVAHRI